MTDEERIDDAYERIDIDTDEILTFYDGERVERCLKSIWDSTVTMHQIATVALKENAKLRELVRDIFEVIEDSRFDPCVERQGKRGPYYEDDPSWRVEIRERMRELGIEVPHD